MYEKCLSKIFPDIIGSKLITREFRAPRTYLVLSEVSEKLRELLGILTININGRLYHFTPKCKEEAKLFENLGGQFALASPLQILGTRPPPPPS